MAFGLGVYVATSIAVNIGILAVLYGIYKLLGTLVILLINDFNNND